MELRFDRMVIEPDTVIPIDARVVGVPGYRVDNQGRILGKGHATRDIVTWSIPVFWPIDLLMLPMRGPRPTLKEETRLTLKVKDEMAVPTTTLPQPDPYGLMHRQPSAELNPRRPKRTLNPNPRPLPMLPRMRLNPLHMKMLRRSPRPIPIRRPRYLPLMPSPRLQSCRRPSRMLPWWSCQPRSTHTFL
jgi:hypothetical protein